MKRGFTLIELLISIAIFSLLSTFVVANYNGNERTKKLKNQTQLVVSGLEQAQNKALAGALADGATPIAYKLTIMSCDNNCNYIITAVFADSEKEEVLVDQKSMSGVSITTSDNSGLEAEFSLPRGRMSLGEGISTFWVQLYNGDNYFCVNLTAVSGRIDIKNGRCQP
jgi:prepilin-type N-terminal cleavage/methylation domain-containing protein